MTRNHERRPDLSECLLEARFLPAFAPGLGPPQFLPETTTNSIIVSGFGGLGSGPGSGGVYPGPRFYYILLGANAGGGFPGATVSVFGMGNGNGASTPAAASSSAGAGSGGGGRGGASTTAGYGSSFSSGYNFGVGAQNGFGMTSTTLGSVPVHTYDNGTVEESRNTRPSDRETSDQGMDGENSLAIGADTRGAGTNPADPFGSRLLKRKKTRTPSPIPADTQGMRTP